MQRNWKLYSDSTEDDRKAWNAHDLLTDPRATPELQVTKASKLLGGIFMRHELSYFSKNKSIQSSWDLWDLAMGLFSNVFVFIGYFHVLNLLLNSVISIGQTTFQLNALQLFNSGFDSFMVQINDLNEYVIKMSDLKNLLALKSDFPKGKVNLPKNSSAPEIVVEELHFRYPESDSDVLNGVSLKIRAGESVAIVGHNGAGKTTLVKLLCRFYLPTEGAIYVNGTDLVDINGDDWRQNLSMLGQDYNRYEFMTAAENIAAGLGDSQINMQRIRWAAQQADADEFIEMYANKYDEVMSERYKNGTRPSTGQWQKLAIARFFYRDVPFVIFDEPTAAIDAVAESKIFSRIYSQLKGKTVIIISHRFSTVRNADRIVVMEQGQIVEEGTHPQLLALNGRYAQAFHLQADSYNAD